MKEAADEVSGDEIGDGEMHCNVSFDGTWQRQVGLLIAQWCSGCMCWWQSYLH